jgi:hypothetical protein
MGVERGSTKHSAREDEALTAELAGELGRGGSNREEWAQAEPPADDDPQPRTGPPVEGAAGTGIPRQQDGPQQLEAQQDEPDQDEVQMRRVQHDLAVADDWRDAVEPATEPGGHGPGRA